MAATASNAPNLRSLVVPSELPSVKQFLDERPELFDILVQGHERLSALFPDATFEHEVEAAPWSKLRVRVYTSEKLKTAIAKFDAFERDWWRAHWDRFGAQIAFHLRFQ